MKTVIIIIIIIIIKDAKITINNCRPLYKVTQTVQLSGDGDEMLNRKVLSSWEKVR